MFMHFRYASLFLFSYVLWYVFYGSICFSASLSGWHKRRVGKWNDVGIEFTHDFVISDYLRCVCKNVSVLASLQSQNAFDHVHRYNAFLHGELSECTSHEDPRRHGGAEQCVL